MNQELFFDKEVVKKQTEDNYKSTERVFNLTKPLTGTRSLWRPDKLRISKARQ
jgi:hypothetical protein